MSEQGQTRWVARALSGLLGAVLVALSPGAGATPLPLEGRDINGNAVAANASNAVFEYDPNLNITWLRDWNYNSGNGFYGTGEMTWNEAMSWASGLTVGKFTGWSLPTINVTNSTDANSGTDYGYNVLTADSALAYMWYVELPGNVPYYDTSGNGPQSGYGLNNTGPFQNMQSSYYWSGTVYAPISDAWAFDTGYGYQAHITQAYYSYAVAVRSGDVLVGAVPEPDTYAMLLAGLGLLGFLGRRRQKMIAA